MQGKLTVLQEQRDKIKDKVKDLSGDVDGRPLLLASMPKKES